MPAGYLACETVRDIASRRPAARTGGRVDAATGLAPDGRPVAALGRADSAGVAERAAGTIGDGTAPSADARPLRPGGGGAATRSSRISRNRYVRCNPSVRAAWVRLPRAASSVVSMRRRLKSDTAP